MHIQGQLLLHFYFTRTYCVKVLQVEKECNLAAGQHFASGENCFSLQSFLDQVPLPNELVQLNKNIFAFCGFLQLKICYILKVYRLQLPIF